MNILSIDVEDWFHVKNLRSAFNSGIWDSTEFRIESNIDLILESLEMHQATATFFVLGWIAEKLPHLIRKINDRGHEIACHGYSHGDYDLMNTNQIFLDIKRGKKTIEDISGEAIKGFRAPNFSISEDLIDILIELGFEYDSSLFKNSFNSAYGNLKNTYPIDKPFFIIKDNLYEFPLSCYNFGKINIPWAGGFYFRAIPFPLYKYGINNIINKKGIFVFYIHPWEFDDLQPRIKNVKYFNRFKHYHNIKNTHFKFIKLLEISKSTSFRHIIAKNIEV